MSADYGDSRWPLFWARNMLIAAGPLMIFFFQTQFLFIFPSVFFGPSSPRVSFFPICVFPPKQILFHTNLSPPGLEFFPHLYPSWGCVRLGVFILPPRPPLFPPQLRNSSQTASVAVVLLAVLIYLFVLGVVGVGKIPVAF